MSRIGKQPIRLPNGVEVTLALPHVVVKGPKGTLETNLHASVSAREGEEDGARALFVEAVDPNNTSTHAQWGTARANLANMVAGVSEGFSRSLEVVGVGYRVQAKGNLLVFNVGHSHDVDYLLPEGVRAAVEKNTITLSGANRGQLGQVAAEIRKIRKPEPYKGKGIRHVGETVRRKVGKATKAGE